MTARPTDPEEAHRTAWLILGTMVTGIAAFAAIAGVLRPDADSGLPWLVIWAVAGPPLAVLAKVLQRRLLSGGTSAAEPYREAAAGDRPPSATGGRPTVTRGTLAASGGTLPAAGRTPAAALTAHVVAWALVEGPAMLGCVAYLMGADAIVLIASLVTAAVGFALTAPRRESFGLR